MGKSGIDLIGSYSNSADIVGDVCGNFRWFEAVEVVDTDCYDAVVEDG